ncbi:MAG: hypothetical protein PHD61_06775 [Bacteroidales bacterium]|nr:hypothetical protein [Lentimicrobiaceae bacterium]MDD5694992.1 hypothetical protein [Bacteroidales bacterium]
MISAEELSAIVNTVNALGIQVAAHATTEEGIEMGINSRVRSIEHGNDFMPELICGIIAVKGNPMEDIGILQHAVFVMKNGKVHKRPE